MFVKTVLSLIKKNSKTKLTFPDIQHTVRQSVGVVPAALCIQFLVRECTYRADANKKNSHKTSYRTISVV